MASKIFTRTSVSFPTGMRPTRRHSSTTIGVKPSRCGELSRFVATEVSRFVLYFLFFFQNSATILKFLLGYSRYTLFAYSWPGYRTVSSVWNGLPYMILRPPFPNASLSDVDCTVKFCESDFAGGGEEGDGVPRRLRVGTMSTALGLSPISSHMLFW